MARAIVLLIPAFAAVTAVQGPSHAVPELNPEDLRRAVADLDWVVGRAPGFNIARFYRAVARSAAGQIGAGARDLHVFLMHTTEGSTFGQAAKFWLDQLGPIGVMARPREPKALWRALRIVGDAERLLSERRDDAAAARCHEALDLLGKGVEGDAFIKEAERHVRQRAYIALARGHARQTAAAAGDEQRRAAARKALEQLQLAVLHGFGDVRQLAQDADLRVLADSPAFRDILVRIRGGE